MIDPTPVENVSLQSVIWVGYTLHYREGGPKLKRVAQTMAQELQLAKPHVRVILQELNSKREFVDAMDAIPEGTLQALHFIGHSGMYGPSLVLRVFQSNLAHTSGAR